MEDHRDFYKWYKTKITENSQDPPEDAWQNIADELDTNDVWERIAVELDSPRGWSASKAIYYSLPVLLLFLLSGGAYYYFSKVQTRPVSAHMATADDQMNATVPASPPTETPASSSSDPQSEKSGDRKEIGSGPQTSKDLSLAGDEITTAKDSDHEKAGNATAIASAKSEARKTDNDSPIIHDIEEDGGKTIAFDQDKHSRDADVPVTTRANEPADPFETPDEFLSVVDEEKETTHASIHTVALPDSMLSIHPVLVALHPDSLQWIPVMADPEKPAHTKTVEFGITMSAKNTWLLNRMTLAGLEKHTMNTTLPDFGKDIGMVFAYNFSPAFSAQAEGMFISEAGQRYKEYRNGKYIDRKVDLRYYTLNLLLKYNRTKAIHGLPQNGHSIIGGLYASMLNKATENIGGQAFVSDAYLDYNYGVILGYEYNRQVMPNLTFTSGLRLNYGFPNIDAGLFSKTFTGSLDLNIAVRYRVGL